MTSIKELTNIGQASADKLHEIGIYTLAQLLEKGASSTGRMRLADEAHLDDGDIKNWVHQADLMRIKGIGPEIAHLLCEVGVCTTPKLAYRSSDTLYAELTTLNQSRSLIGRVPSRDELHEYITEAKRLPKLIRH